jgi:hypothetical protein
MIDDFRTLVGRACFVVMLQKSIRYYRSKDRDDNALRSRIPEISHVRVLYGIQRIYALSRCEEL